MSLRGEHVGQLKRIKAIEDLDGWASETGHELSHLTFEPVKGGFRKGKANTQSWLVYSTCRRRGSPWTFKNKPCSDEQTPLGNVLLRQLQQLCRQNSANKPKITEAFKLSAEEKGALTGVARPRYFFQSTT